MLTIRSRGNDSIESVPTVASAEVLANGDRDRGSAWQHDVELLRCIPDLRVPPRCPVDVDDGLLALEPVAAADSDEERGRGEHEEKQDPSDDADDPAPLPGLLVM